MRVLGFVYMGIFALSAKNFLTKGVKLIPSPAEARARVVALEHKAPYAPPPPPEAAELFRLRFPDVDVDDGAPPPPILRSLKKTTSIHPNRPKHSGQKAPALSPPDSLRPLRPGFAGEPLVHAARCTWVLPDGTGYPGTAFLTPELLCFAGDQARGRASHCHRTWYRLSLSCRSGALPKLSVNAIEILPCAATLRGKCQALCIGTPPIDLARDSLPLHSPSSPQAGQERRLSLAALQGVAPGAPSDTAGEVFSVGQFGQVVAELRVRRMFYD